MASGIPTHIAKAVKALVKVFMRRMIQRSLHLLLSSVVVSTLVSASSELPVLVGQAGVPFGYDDTEASGARMANQDLAGGEVKYAVYGLPSKPFVDKLVSSGVTLMFMGCLMGGEGTSFWTGYNDYMESRLPGRIPAARLTKMRNDI